MADQGRSWQEFNLNLTEIFGPQSDWPEELTDAIAIARAPLVTFSENNKRATQAVQTGPIAHGITFMLNFDDRDHLPIVMAFYQYLSLKLQEFIEWPMTAYTTEVRMYNMGRRDKGLIDFRSACWAAKICAAADMTMLRAIGNDEEPLSRIFFPRLEANSRFHRIPLTGPTDLEKTSSKVFPYSQPIQSSFESLRGIIPTSKAFDSVPAGAQTLLLNDAQIPPVRSSSLVNNSKSLADCTAPQTQPPTLFSQELQFPPPVPSSPQKSPPSLRREPRRIQDFIRRPLKVEGNRRIRRDVITSAGLMAKERRQHDPLRVERKPTIRRPTYEGIKRLFSLSADDLTDTRTPMAAHTMNERKSSGRQQLMGPRAFPNTETHPPVGYAKHNTEKHSPEEEPQTVIRHDKSTRHLFDTPLNRPVPVHVPKTPIVNRLIKRLSDSSIERAPNEDEMSKNIAGEETMHGHAAREKPSAGNPWTPLQAEYREKLLQAAQEAAFTPKSATHIPRDGFWY